MTYTDAQILENRKKVASSSGFGFGSAGVSRLSAVSGGLPGCEAAS